MLGDIRKNLRGSIAASAAPYGYTLTVWSSGAVSIHVMGSPSPGEVLLFLAGASLAFLTVAGIAYGELIVELSTPQAKRQSLLATTHVLSVGSAVMAAWGVTSLLEAPAGWPAAGFVATVLYLLITAAETTAASPGEG